MRSATALAGIAMFAGVLGAPFANAPQSLASSGGAIDLFATPGSGVNGTIVITGAIGDFGKTLDVDRSGKPDTNGSYERIILQRGTFELNLANFAAAASRIGPASNAATCSMSYVISAAVAVLNGTGIYQGITGNLNLTSASAFIFSRYPSGKTKGACNSNAAPVAHYGSVQGSGTVHFS